MKYTRFCKDNWHSCSLTSFWIHRQVLCYKARSYFFFKHFLLDSLFHIGPFQTPDVGRTQGRSAPLLCFFSFSIKFPSDLFRHRVVFYWQSTQISFLGMMCNFLVSSFILCKGWIDSGKHWIPFSTKSEYIELKVLSLIV